MTAPTAPTVPTALWDRYPRHLRPVRPPVPLGNAGGLSGSAIWRAEAGSGPIAVRAWPVPAPAAEHLRRVHGWLARAARWSVVATPLAGSSGAGWFEVGGRSWELAPWRPGRPDLGQPPTDAHLRGIFAGLATFHLILQPRPEGRGPSPGLVSRLGEVETLIGGDLSRLRAARDRLPPDPASGMVRDWFDRVPQVAPELLDRLRQAATRTVALQPCLRDARPDHFLFTDDELTGLIDFGAMGVDTISTDLARLLGETVGREGRGRRVALDAYEAVRPLDPTERDRVATFEAANALLGVARWVRWRAVEGRRFDDEAAAEARFRRSLERFAAWWGPEAGQGGDGVGPTSRPS